jgi:hypothetical protein
MRTKSGPPHSPRFYLLNNLPMRLVTANFYDAEETSLKAGGKEISAYHLLSRLFYARLSLKP